MRKILLAGLICMMMTAGLCGCASGVDKKTEEDVTIRVGAMAGPTAMGMVKLMSDSDAGKTVNKYEFAELMTDASALVAPIASGELDIAAVPANLAATIYNNTEGKIEVVSACALGVLNLVERGESVSSLSDLAGKTIYATGQGAVPEYTIRYLLDSVGVNPDEDVDFVWCADTTEALSYVKNMEGAIAVLPQPFVTAACAQVEDLRVVCDLNEVWDAGNSKSSIITGVVVVRKEFADSYPEQMDAFVNEYKKSVEFAQNEIDETAKLIVEYGIVAAEPIAKKALPGCHVVCIMGDDLKDKLGGFLQIVYDMNPKAVGGQIPGEDFYYSR